MPLTEAQAEALVDRLADDAALLHGVVHGDAETEVVTEGGIVPSVAKVIASAEEALTGPVAVAEGWADKAQDWAEAPEDGEVEAGKYSARHWAAKAQAVRDSLGDVMVFRGAFDASTGSYPSDPVQGDLYTVTVSGSVGGTALVAGDEIIYGPAGWILVGRNRSASEIVALITGNFTDGAHGPRGGGALHAPATTSVAGFMSAADKSYLDSLPDALSAKANASDVASALAEKADASAVTSALAEKADASAVTSALAEKADAAALAGKADANTALPLGGTTGQLLAKKSDDDFDGEWVAPPALDNAKLATLTFVIDGGGAAIATGIKGDLEIPFGCTIEAVTLLADQSGSIVVDIWKDTYANYPPTDADSITASAVPTISAATKSTDATLTGWTTSIAAGDILRFNVDSAATTQRVTISLKVRKT